MTFGFRTFRYLGLSFARFFRYLLDKRFRVANAIGGLVSNAEHDRRISICRVCPEYLPQTTQCRECTCYVNLKAMLAHEQCPLRRW